MLIKRCSAESFLGAAIAFIISAPRFAQSEASKEEPLVDLGNHRQSARV
jgi:hypothetical protein